MPSAAQAGFSTPTDQDKRGWLWLATVLSITYSLIFYATRLYVKNSLLWWDDLVLGIGHLVAIARWALTMTTIVDGIGTAGKTAVIDTSGKILDISKYLHYAGILLSICLYMSRMSIALMLRKIFSGNMNNKNVLFYLLFGMTGAACFGSILALSVACELSLRPAGHGLATCSHQSIRWIVDCILQSISETLIIAAAAYLTHGVQMQAKQKWYILVLFSFRIGVILLTIAMTAVYVKDTQSGLRFAIVLVLQEVTLCYSFLSATVLCLKSFIEAFYHSSHFMAGVNTGFEQTGNGSYALRSIGKKEEVGRVDHAKAMPEDGSQIYNHAVGYHADVKHSDRTREEEVNSIDSDASQRMMIRRHVEFNVHRG